MANTLKLGAGKWATGTDTVLAFNDENNNFKPLPFDFSRASSATVVNQSGLIETVGSGEPRIDFKDNTKGALLLEPQRTNLILYSQDFSNASWNTSSTRSVDFAPTSTTDPEGKTNAYRVTSTASNNQVAIFGSIISGQVYTNSIYVRRVSGSGNIILRNVNNEENNFQLSVSDGWKRIETTATSTSTFGRLYINLQTVGDVIEIWGGQVEQGSYPTSYIPTSGQSGGVTRVGDVCSQTVPDGVIGQTEGTFYLDFKKEHNALETWSINDGSSSNRVYMGFNNSDFISQVRSSSGAAQASFTTGLNNNTRYKCALAYKFNDFVLYINGVQIGTDNSGVVPLNMSKLSAYASTSSDAPFFSPTNDVKLYNTRLSNSELQALTTI